MSLSDEAIKRRDECAIYYKGNIVRAGHSTAIIQLIAEQAFKDGFEAGVEVGKSEPFTTELSLEPMDVALLRRIEEEQFRANKYKQELIAVKEELHQERARSQKLVEQWKNIRSEWLYGDYESLKAAIAEADIVLAHKAGEK